MPLLYFALLCLLLGSITSRCAGKEPALLPSGRNVDRTRESGGNRAYLFTDSMEPQAGDLVKPVKSLRRKFEFKTLSALKIQIDSFDFGERLTRETDFVGVGSSPHRFIMEFRPFSLLRTVYFTKRPAGGPGCQIFTSHPVFFAPTICKLNSIFRRRNKSTRDSLAFLVLGLARFRIFAVDLWQVYAAGYE